MIVMKMLGYTLIALSAMSAAAASAQEQGKSDWDKIVLEDKAGNVMTSTGGDYQTAPIGKQLIIGEHMMLGDATKAKVVYYELDDNGKVLRRCVKDYTDPNTYIIDAVCTAGAAWTNGGAISGANAGIIVGAGVIGAALLNGADKVEVGPLSNAVRHL
jgi:hypothetical protein